MLLPAIIVGPVVRATPEGWFWPERIAASILGTDEETAGVRLIKTAAPDRWRDIVAGHQIISVALQSRNANEAGQKRPARFAVPLKSEA